MLTFIALHTKDRIMLKKIVWFVFILTVTSQFGVFAQNDASRKRVAEELLVVAHAQESFNETMEKALEGQSKILPEENRAAFVGAMKDFINTYMKWEVIKSEMVNLYASEFTESELKELIAFYKTPIGQKILIKLPAITTRSMEIGTKILTDHKEELTQLMMKAMEK